MLLGNVVAGVVPVPILLQENKYIYNNKNYKIKKIELKVPKLFNNIQDVSGFALHQLAFQL